ncbi:MAG TPA: FAD-dependent oxidoreductase [Candidatus Cybelea sp.]|nr:FAD-dependent oxidoreductase [Candidatus Cybelea sp.]
MAETIDADICVIGGGSGGLTVAAGASYLGAKVVLFERGRMGGDCLNYGCVPSKALLAAAKLPALARRAPTFGVHFGMPDVDFAAVGRHVHGVIASIAPFDSVARFEGLGVRVIQAPARFVARDRAEGGGVAVRARRFVIATGSRAAVPPIPGLDRVPFLTNETVFDNPNLPDHLVVIGAGPIGLEMAQAHRRLGARVTVLEALPSALTKDDPELAALVIEHLRAEGIEFRFGAAVTGVAGGPGDIRVTLGGRDGAGGDTLSASHLLVAAGRRPNLEDLGLDAAGVKHSPKGIAVDKRLRTSNRKIFAVGDCAGGPQFTHIAGYHGGIVLRNALFRLPAKVDHDTIPWVTFTDPELAHAGLSEAAARQRYGAIRILRWPYAENDRAQAERETHGMIKIVTSKRGRILGADIVGAHAGELIQPWVLAVAKKLGVGAMAGIVLPYPTLGEIGKRASGTYFARSLFDPRLRWVVRMLGRFG